MFFVLSKVFWFFAQPLNFAILLLGIGLLGSYFFRSRIGPLAIVCSFAILLVGAWTTAGALIMHPLEARFHRPSPMPAKIDGIIVLGGAFEAEINLARGGYELNAGGDRLVEAVALARRYPDAKVVITGGSGDLIFKGEPDAETAPRLMAALGIPAERLVLENQSRNTYENAIFTRRLLDPQPGQVWLLVTSAFHMPRSVGLFRHAGFEVVPWPSDYRTTGEERVGISHDDPLQSLGNLTIAFREWVGLIAYRPGALTRSSHRRNSHCEVVIAPGRESCFPEERIVAVEAMACG